MMIMLVTMMMMLLVVMRRMRMRMRIKRMTRRMMMMTMRRKKWIMNYELHGAGEDRHHVHNLYDVMFRLLMLAQTMLPLILVIV